MAYGADDPGGGPYDPETGLRDWYNAEPPKPKGESFQLRWTDILNAWPAITLDLHETFGIDVESGVLTQRTWWWLQDRIFDLIDRPSRLRSALNIPATVTIN